VAQHPLQHLHVRARGDGQRSAGVAEVVEAERGEPRPGHRRRPCSPAEVLEENLGATELILSPEDLDALAQAAAAIEIAGERYSPTMQKMIDR
jgi:hypothetical protein